MWKPTKEREAEPIDRPLTFEPTEPQPLEGMDARGMEVRSIAEPTRWERPRNPVKWVRKPGERGEIPNN